MAGMGLQSFDDLWDYDNPAETELRFLELLSSSGYPSANRAYGAELLTQIARCQGLQRRFDEAHRTLDEAASLLSDDLRRARVRYLLERGRVFNSSRRPEMARPLFLQAFEVAIASQEDALAVDAAHMMAIVEPLEKQLAWNMQALDVAEKSPDPRARKWLASLFNNIGWTYYAEGKYQDALGMFRKAHDFRLLQGDDEETRIARWCVAKALRALSRVDEALSAQRELEQEYAALRQPSGYVFEEIGECLLALDRRAEARPYFALAHGELSKDRGLEENEPERLRRLAELGAVQGGQC